MADALHVHLAPGASGTSASMRPWTDGLAARGFPASTVALPRGTAERAIPVYRAAVTPGPSVVIGGQSFGGRVASLIAADESPAGLVLLCYPLHRPGHPETADDRTAHWPRIGCPVLLLSGEADPFARIELLRAAVPRLPEAELVTWPGIGHGLNRVREDALDRIAAWLSGL
ncbi:MAG TPA: alpha/beta family hydrolase [Candidatus Limnocylindria bacterium]